jgi:hypothetical protein
VPTGWIRSHLGDVLAVLLVYFGLRAATPLGILPASAAALATAVAIEAAQWLQLADPLAIPATSPARMILGSRFDAWDLLAYVTGAGAALALKAARPKRR